MRTRPAHGLEKFRVLAGVMASPPNANWGAFLVGEMNVLASPAEPGRLDWEHVSVSYPTRTPTWDEMCEVKKWFWDPEETVIQLHPPESEHVNHRPHCLHLWRSVVSEQPRPPKWAVGAPEDNPEAAAALLDVSNG